MFYHFCEHCLYATHRRKSAEGEIVHFLSTWNQLKIVVHVNWEAANCTRYNCIHSHKVGRLQRVAHIISFRRAGSLENLASFPFWTRECRYIKKHLAEDLFVVNATAFFFLCEYGCLFQSVEHYVWIVITGSTQCSSAFLTLNAAWWNLCCFLWSLTKIQL